MEMHLMTESPFMTEQKAHVTERADIKMCHTFDLFPPSHNADSLTNIMMTAFKLNCNRENTATTDSCQ